MYKHLNVYKEINSVLKDYLQAMCLLITYNMNRKNLPIYNLQWLICYKMQPNQTIIINYSGKLGIVPFYCTRFQIHNSQEI